MHRVLLAAFGLVLSAAAHCADEIAQIQQEIDRIIRIEQDAGDSDGGPAWWREIKAEVREVRGLGLMVGIEIKQKVAPFLQALTARGVLAQPAGLTEIRLLGAKGMGQIQSIMDHLRQEKIAGFGDFVVERKIDRWEGPPQPHLSRTDTSSRNVLIFHLTAPPDTRSLRVTVRPSGTEPVVRVMVEGEVESEVRSAAEEIAAAVRQAPLQQ